MIPDWSYDKQTELIDEIVRGDFLQRSKGNDSFYEFWASSILSTIQIGVGYITMIEERMIRILHASGDIDKLKNIGKHLIDASNANNAQGIYETFCDTIDRVIKAADDELISEL